MYACIYKTKLTRVFRKHSTVLLTTTTTTMRDRPPERHGTCPFGVFDISNHRKSPSPGSHASKDSLRKQATCRGEGVLSKLAHYTYYSSSITISPTRPNQSTEKSHPNLITLQRNKPQRRSPSKTVFVVVRILFLQVQQATERWRPRWRPVSPDIDMLHQKLAKQG
jgi:hypothetical protein